MRNLGLDFTASPWLLLLIIPSIALTLIPYFRLSKRHRKTRNRIVSMTLHIIIMVLTTCVLSGMIFTYDIPNDENEIIILVDISDTEELGQTTLGEGGTVGAAVARDELVETIIGQGTFDGYKMGIVTFGFNQEYIAPLTYDIRSLSDSYAEGLYSGNVDTSATNIAAALNFTKDLFKHPQTGKIVLITDGKETDEKATEVIRAVTASGIRIDVAYVGSSYQEEDVQVVDVELPDYHVNVNEECAINVTLQSKMAGEIAIELYDNGALLGAGDRIVSNIVAGTHKYTFRHTFASEGLHELGIKISIGGGEISKNDEYTSYMYLEVFNNILIIESFEGESTELETFLKDNGFQATIVNIQDQTATNIPKSVDELRMFDQIILNNIANSDLIKYNELTGKGNTNPNLVADFDKVLEEYVSVYGGGLFTVGGNEGGKNNIGEDVVAHAYSRADMYNTTYQKMLPVQAINYTPPLGVMVIIDRSGSMSTTDSDGVPVYEWALEGASACLDALTERDYMGLMTLDSDYTNVLPLTARTQENKIREGIETLRDMGTGGGTVFYTAIERAGQALRALDAVDKKHMIIVSDCEAGDNPADYEALIKEYYEMDGITLSIVGINMQGPSKVDSRDLDINDYVNAADTYGKMCRAICNAEGYLYCIRSNSEFNDIVPLMREDLNVPEIKELVHEEFKPHVSNRLSPVVKDVLLDTESEQAVMTTTLSGFYGTKARPTADVILEGNFRVPLYAQWKYGEGMVGSFMCDLNGTWSGDFMADAEGRKVLNNIFKNLMPVENIRPSEIDVSLKEYNYINQLSVFADLAEGEKITGEVLKEGEGNLPVSLSEITTDVDALATPVYVTLGLTVANNFSRTNIIIKESGTYKITLNKVDAAGNIVATYSTYKTFSYSKEYDTFVDPENIIDYKAQLEHLAYRGNGLLIEDNGQPDEIFAGFITKIHREFDPRFLFIIISIVAFLLDIAVRKFKFKWPHEIIRDRKAKKNSK